MATSIGAALDSPETSRHDQHESEGKCVEHLAQDFEVRQWHASNRELVLRHAFRSDDASDGTFKCDVCEDKIIIPLEGEQAHIERHHGAEVPPNQLNLPQLTGNAKM